MQSIAQTLMKGQLSYSAGLTQASAVLWGALELVACRVVPSWEDRPGLIPGVSLLLKGARNEPFLFR